MGKKRKIGAEKKKTGFLCFFSLLAGLIIIWHQQGFAMDAMTQSELGDLSGQVGLTISYMNSTTDIKVQAHFNAISVGDTDGWGDNTAGNNNPCWLVLIGDGSNTGTLGINLSNYTLMKIDVATAGSSGCNPAGGAPYAGLFIPADTPYFTFSLSELDFSLTSPQTVNIALSGSAGTNGDTMGYMLAENVAIDKANKTSSCYMWFH